jgi:oligosaccharyltransferase complex subunit alpha (ribophorin I)
VYSTLTSELSTSFTTKLTFTRLSFSCSGTYSYTVDLPKPLSINGTVNLVVEAIHTHTTYAWPKEVGQEADQALKYEGDLLVLSPYKTTTQRIKVR